MPLIKGKSPKAFEHNLKAEMHAGKPQPQALAIAYSVKRKAQHKKKASGGTVESGSKDMNYADGGDVSIERTASARRKYDSQKSEKGVNTPRMAAYPGESAAGYATRGGHAGGTPEYKGAFSRREAVPASTFHEQAKKEHKKTLEESKSIKPKLQGLAEGGSVKRERPYSSEGQKGWTHEKDYTAGVHREQGGGESHAGQVLRKPNYGSMQSYEGSIESAKRAHQRVLEESRSMPKPKLQGLAEGGSISASNERRPMPDNTYDDSKEVAHNSSHKNNGEDGWTQNPTVKQAQNNSGRMVKPIKYPRMASSGVFQAKLRDQEDDMQESMRPGAPSEQPERSYDEESPDRQGPKISDMEDEHSTHRKPYAKGGQIEASDKMSHNINKRTMMEPEDDSEEMHERRDQNDHMLEDSPSEDEGAQHARMLDEEDPDRHGPAVPDMEDEHSTGHKPYAGGGRIGDALDNIHDELDLNPAHDHWSKDDSEMQPEDEEEMEHHDSIAAAIMAKKDREAMHGADSDSDIDHEMMMAEGGKIKSKGSWDTHESADQADLSRNADEDANEEDQMSFGALRKENYSESEGLHQLDNPMDSGEHGDEEEHDSEDAHDMVSKIMAKMNRQRQFKAR